MYNMRRRSEVSSRLTNVVSTTPVVSDFTNDRTGNVFVKCWGLDLLSWSVNLLWHIKCFPNTKETRTIVTLDLSWPRPSGACQPVRQRRVPTGPPLEKVSVCWVSDLFREISTVYGLGFNVLIVILYGPVSRFCSRKGNGKYPYTINLTTSLLSLKKKLI